MFSRWQNVRFGKCPQKARKNRNKDKYVTELIYQYMFVLLIYSFAQLKVACLFLFIVMATFRLFPNETNVKLRT